MKSAIILILLLSQTYAKSTSLMQLTEALSELNAASGISSKNDDLASLASKITKIETDYGTQYKVQDPNITILIYPKSDSPIIASITYNGGEATPGGAEVALSKSGLLRIGKTSRIDRSFSIQENINPAQLSEYKDFLTDEDIYLIKLGLKIFDSIQSKEPLT